MPYKSKEDRAGNKRIWHFVRQLNFYRSMGLEPIDVRDNRSNLECRYCGRITPRSCAHMFRHEDWCPMLEGLENKLRSWRRTTKVFVGNCNKNGSRKHIFGDDGFCTQLGCTQHKDDADNQRRRNVETIANKRKQLRLEI